MVTAIDKNTALVLIDFQNGIIKMSLAHPIKEILEKAASLVEAFRKAKLPVVIVNVVPKDAAWLKSRKDSAVRSAATAPSPDFAGIVDEIKTLPTDIFVTKQTWNAFYNTSLHEELQKHGVTNIVLAGVSTSAGVEGTARAASEMAYNISFAIDAMTDSNAEAHLNSIKNIFPRLGESGTSAEIIKMLETRI